MTLRCSIDAKIRTSFNAFSFSFSDNLFIRTFKEIQNEINKVRNSEIAKKGKITILAHFFNKLYRNLLNFLRNFY